MRFFVLSLFLTGVCFGQELLKSGTNTLIVSEEVAKRAWSRTAVMADAQNRPLDPSGKLAAYADAAAVGEAADRAGEIGDSAREAMNQSIGALVAVTNDIPEGAQHIAVRIPSLGSPNLQGVVIEEGVEGSNDWQVVRFNSLLSVPPSRSVEYTYPGGSATVEARWDWPWVKTNYAHRCTFPRPALFPAGSVVIRSRSMEIFGGKKGFGFGSAVVSVDGALTFTGAVTNDLTGAILNFENGVLK